MKLEGAERLGEWNLFGDHGSAPRTSIALMIGSALADSGTRLTPGSIEVKGSRSFKARVDC